LFEDTERLEVRAGRVSALISDTSPEALSTFARVGSRLGKTEPAGRGNSARETRWGPQEPQNSRDLSR
jgi:hypothetical protein